MSIASRPAVAVLAAGLGAANPISTEPFAGLDLLWVRPATEAQETLHCARLLVLNLPRDWVVGDAAVAIFADDPADHAVRRLAEALLLELAAVLEVPQRTAEGCRVPPASPVADVLGAVRALRVDASAGLVVGIGVGSSGPAVLAATGDEVAARLLGADGPRLAAGIALDRDGQASFALGAPPEGQAWTDRVKLLCAALASATSQVRPDTCLAGLDGDRAMARTGPRTPF